jgi:hypothetical protein
MKLPNELLLQISQECDYNTLIEMRVVCHNFNDIVNYEIIPRLKEKSTVLIKVIKDLQKEHVNLKTFLNDEITRYNSFMDLNMLNINEASWFCKPFTELFLVCQLLCMLHGFYHEKWKDIQKHLKTIAFKNWYSQLNNNLQLNELYLDTIVKIIKDLRDDFIDTLQDKSYVGHIMYINMYSAIQVCLIKRDLELDKNYLLKNNIKKNKIDILLNSLKIRKFLSMHP